MSIPANSNESGLRFAVDRGDGKPLERFATKAEAIAARDIMRSVGWTRAVIYVFDTSFGCWLPDR